jgi:hypothetical protein
LPQEVASLPREGVRGVSASSAILGIFLGSYFVESWRHGTGNIDSDCSKPSKVYNVDQITFKNFNVSFPSSDDHSKWMASDEKKLICVGDINRQVKPRQTPPPNSIEIPSRHIKSFVAEEQFVKKRKCRWSTSI